MGHPVFRRNRLPSWYQCSIIRTTFFRFSLSLFPFLRETENSDELASPRWFLCKICPEIYHDTRDTESLSRIIPVRRFTAEGEFRSFARNFMEHANSILCARSKFAGKKKFLRRYVRETKRERLSWPTCFSQLKQHWFVIYRNNEH